MSTETLVLLELGGAVLGTMAGLVISESWTRALYGDPMLTTEHGAFEIQPYSTGGAYYLMFAPFVISTAVSLTGDALEHDGSYLGSLVGAIVGMASALVLTVLVAIAQQDLSSADGALVVTGLVLPAAGAVIGFEL